MSLLDTRTPVQGDPVQNPPDPSRSTGWVTALIRRFHFYAGLLVGPFILVAAVTGGLYAFAPQLDESVHATALHVPASSTSLTLADQVAAATRYAGGAAPVAVRPAPGSTDTTRVMFASKGLGESERRAVFVDPGTGAITGDMTVYGSSGSLPARTWLDYLHRNFHLGSPGRLYSELAASWLWVLAVGGIVVWIHRWRRSRRPLAALVVPAGTVRSGGGGRRGTLAWHGVTGTWVLLGLLFLSATGVTWSQLGGANVTKLRDSLGWQTPTVSTKLVAGPGVGTSPAGSGDHADHQHDAAGTGSGGAAVIDAVLATARAAAIDSPKVELAVPSTSTTAWKVIEVDRSWPTNVDAVAVDPSTMTVTDRAFFADFGIVPKLVQWGIALHMGVLFGLVNQIALVLLAFAATALVILGYRMWWQRRPTRDQPALLARPRLFDVLRDVPRWALVLIGAVTVAVGWFLPMFGMPLALFLAVDAVIAARARRRA